MGASVNGQCAPGVHFKTRAFSSKLGRLSQLAPFSFKLCRLSVRKTSWAVDSQHFVACDSLGRRGLGFWGSRPRARYKGLGGEGGRAARRDVSFCTKIRESIRGYECSASRRKKSHVGPSSACARSRALRSPTGGESDRVSARAGGE